MTEKKITAPDNQDLDVLFSDVRSRQEAVALEALTHVYVTTLSSGEPFALSDGRWAILRPFIDPTVNDDGVLECGLDIKLSATKEDAENKRYSGHLEFYMRKTGWGGATQ